MSSTTEVSTWVVDLATLGPIYPFVGSEFILYIAGLVFWIAFHIMQGSIETREFEDEQRAMKDPARFKEALDFREIQKKH